MRTRFARRGGGKQAKAVRLNAFQIEKMRVAGQLGDWKTARSALERFVATAPPKQYARDLVEVRGALADMSRRGL